MRSPVWPVYLNTKTSRDKIIRLHRILISKDSLDIDLIQPTRKYVSSSKENTSTIGGLVLTGVRGACGLT